MATKTLTNVDGGTNPFTTADTAATGNTLALRDSGGNLVMAQASATELKTTGLLTLALSTKSASFTADVSAVVFLCDATSGALVPTLPAASSCPGRVYVFKKTDSSGNAVTITRAGSDTIDGATTKALASQYNHAVIQSDGGTAWNVLA